MFELTNEQRKCFALAIVNPNWERIQIKSSPYDTFKTYVYCENNIIRKCVLTSEIEYCEYELCEVISDDGKYLLPKTQKGKPVLLSSTNLLKRTSLGMCLNYNHRHITLYNSSTECSYYSTSYVDTDIATIKEFEEWVNNWCSETNENDIVDIENFAKQSRRNIKFKEGDVFRFKIDRRLYGYGRVILDFDKMRKRKEPFWDILMSKPLVCSAYHIATERNDVTIDELKKLKALPSTIIADNCLFYGEYEIIGNIPLSENEDYPIMYGRSIDIRKESICFQYGKTFKEIENGVLLYGGFTNNGVSFTLNIQKNVLLECIQANSNIPYWENYFEYAVNRDLRNPKYNKERIDIGNQMGVILE